MVRYAARVADDPHGNKGRRQTMNTINPRYVLRNYLAQEAIELAEAGDLRRVHELLDALREPYAEKPGLTLCRQEARLGPKQGRLLDAVLQLLNHGSEFWCGGCRCAVDLG